MTALSVWMVLGCVVTEIYCRTVRLQVAGNYDRSFTNGPGGKCELSSEDGRSVPKEVVCPSPWMRNGTYSTSRKTLRNRRKCSYFKKTITYLCFGSKEGKNGSHTCEKKVSYYMLSSSCSDTWLSWESCDKSCGGGVTTRVKFSSAGRKYEKMTERRPCNTSPCPQWGPWEPRMGPNGTVPCNMSTCTRTWERHCLSNNGSVRPALCAKEGSGDNVSQQQMNCSEEECIDATQHAYIQTTSREVETSTFTSATQPPSISTGFTNEAQTSGLLNASSVNSPGIHLQNVFKAGPQTDNKLWLGFGIGLLVALCFFSVTLLARNQWLRIKARKNPKKPGDSQTDGVQETAPTPFRLERMPASTSEEGLYSTVLHQPDLRSTQNIYVEREVDINSRSLAGNNSSSPGADQATSDPLYSAIPAYDAECYPSSEFDSTDSDSPSEARSLRLPSTDLDKEVEMTPTAFDAAEDGCKSFDSDEGRDIVHTLRKPSTRSRRSPPKNDAPGDVFLSDEEVRKEDHDSERRFAFSRRYSKILAKKAKKSMSWGRNKSVKADFKWIEGRRWTASTNSDCSTQSTYVDGESAPGSKTLSNQGSVATCSTASVSVDATTSGYNSAIGDSAEESFIPRNLGLENPDAWKRYRSHTANSIFATERRNHFGDIRSKSQNSSAIQLDSRNDLLSPGVDGIVKHPFHTSRPSQQKSRSLLSRLGRLIPVDDIYSSPADAEVRNAENPQHWEYDLPVDALRSKSVLT